VSPRGSRARAPLHDLRSGRRRLDGPTSSYLFRVLRLVVGDELVVFDPVAHTESRARVVRADVHEGEIEADEPEPSAVRARRALVLVQSLSKGDKLDAIVRDATELGATAVIVARARRSVVQVDGARAEARLERLRRVAEQAARQCGRADPPEIVGPLDWSRALAAALDRASPASVGGAFCLHPHGAATLGALLVDAVARGGGLAFAIGPEGGLTDDELSVAAEAGFVTASFGARVLRTETVAAAVLGAVCVLEAD
jgi:16S rRNA (uracil1498-N3)-methyltransferase